jgi:hypothetical protein
VRPKTRSSADVLEIDVGPWAVLNVKSNASAVQRQVVPWFIAIYGLSYSKSLKLDVVKEVVIATTAQLGLLDNCQAAAEEFNVGLTDVARKVKAAAGMYFNILPL